MNQASVHPLEAVLRLCAAASPGAWHPLLHAQKAGIDPDPLFNILELLWLEGLVQKGEGTRENGPGVTLTPLGQQVLDDPAALERLRRGQPVDPLSTGGIIRGSLVAPVRPLMTRAILIVNLAVFAYGALVASRVPGLIQTYLTGFGPGGMLASYSEILHRLGGVTASDLVAGDWWRLLSATFVHRGVLHLGMNMYALYALGTFVEQTWGRWRYLTIYLIGGWGGSCLAMGLTPGGLLVGASGALCGVLGADGIWVLLGGKHLPRNLARRARAGIITNGILIGLMSLLPGVSWAGHLGGAIAGAATALILHFQRFGPRPLRVLGVLAVPAVVWGCWTYLDHQRATGKPWQQLERRALRRLLVEQIGEPMQQIQRAYERNVLPLARLHPSRRAPERVKTAQENLEKGLTELSEMETRLERIRPYRDETREKMRQASLDYIQAGQAMFRAGLHYLQLEKVGQRDDAQREEKEQDFLTAAENWEKALAGDPGTNEPRTQ